MQNEAGEYVDMYIPRYVKLRAVQCDPMCGVQEVFRLQPDPVRQGPRQHPDQPRRRGRVDREDDGMSGPVSQCRLNSNCISQHYCYGVVTAGLVQDVRHLRGDPADGRERRLHQQAGQEGRNPGQEVLISPASFPGCPSLISCQSIKEIIHH